MCLLCFFFKKKINETDFFLQNTPKEIFSDPKKVFLDLVTKQFFLTTRFLLETSLFFFSNQEKKNLCEEKKISSG